MRFLLVIIWTIFHTHIAHSKDTLKLMQYNLTYYGQSTNWCNSSNNNVITKENYLKEIIQHVQPDILGVNELGVNFSGGDNIIAERLLVNTLSSNYSKANHSANASICNMLYYNNQKLGLSYQTAISKDLNGDDLVRVIDFYTLYYKDSLLALHEDTSFLTIGVAHFKAGDDFNGLNRIERSKAAAAVMDHVENNYADRNILFMGDFNLYTHEEAAYQTLINNDNAAINFYDPLNESGIWHENNSEYGLIHTQSTRVDTNTNDGCFASGGLDDRFDFILINNAVKDGLNGVQYLDNSYTTLGQDGAANDNNSPLNIVDNNSVPKNIAKALYEVSDHLPVVSEFTIESKTINSINLSSKLKLTLIQNFSEESLNLYYLSTEENTHYTIKISSIDGKQFIPNYTSNTANNTKISLSNLTSGFYILSVFDKSGNYMLSKKFIK